MRIRKTKKEIIFSLKNILLIIVGTSLLAFGTGVFIVPFDLVTGGVSGIAIILNKLINAKNLSVDFYATVLTWVLFFIGLIFLGKSFALKTLISSIIYPIVLSLSMRLVSPNVLNGFFYLEGYVEFNQMALLLGALFGGVFVGAGCAITFLGGGSTGGVDIISFTFCKFVKKIRSSHVMFLVDATIIILGMFVINNLIVSLLGITSAFVNAIVIDKLFLGQSKAFVAEIVSDKYEEINQAVINVLDRTTTIVDVTGGYSKEKKKMVIVSFSMDQYALLTTLLHDIDKDAFITINRAHEINGEGWEKDENDIQEKVQ